MKEFKNPEVKVITFTCEDVIAVSSGNTPVTPPGGDTGSDTPEQPI